MTTWKRSMLEWLVLVGLMLALWFPAASGMAVIWWRSDTYAHGLLVLPIAAWLVWRDRTRWMALTPRRWAWGLLPLAAAALLALAGELAQVAAASQFAVVLALQGLTLLVLGPELGRVLAFPLVFLFFGVPIGDFLLPWMMGWTADFTVAALRLVGVPVYREGLQFVIPSGHWSVVEACSGVRYLMASMMVGTLFAYLNYGSLRKRLIFIGFAIVAPLLANWLRAFGIVMLGHLSNNKLATGVDHLVYGWVFFGLVMALMFVVGGRFVDQQAPRPNAGGSSRGVAGLPVAWVSLGLLMLALPPALALALRHPGPPLSESQWALQVPGWRDAPAAEDWHPAIENPQALLRRGFAADAGVVWVDLAYYPRQAFGSKAVSGENVLVRADDREWQVLNRGTEGWQMRRRGSGEEQFLLRRLHWVDGRFIESPAAAKLAHAWALLKGQGDAAALVLIRTAADPQAAQRLDAFWTQAQAPLNACLQTTVRGPQVHNAGRCR
ncbi:exosortase A [Inhella sp.]|uniref:exosortase A n=1 Tax=Inhella sp. TaxID=1921806 RepID=UPI0035B1B395